MKNRNFSPLPGLFGILLAASGAACGNNLTHNGFRTLDQWSSGSFLTSVDPYGACTGTANILPRSDVTLDGRDRYIACASPESLFRIRLWGESSAGTTNLCVFAAITEATGQVRIQRDEQGRPSVICGTVDPENGSDFVFEDITYDSVFVVPVGSRNAMMSCLSAGNPLTCPNYSFGQFRE